MQETFWMHIDTATRILIHPAYDNIDEISTAIALSSYLMQQKKQPILLLKPDIIPKNIRFLPDGRYTNDAHAHEYDLIIDLNTCLSAHHHQSDIPDETAQLHITHQPDLSNLPEQRIIGETRSALSELLAELLFSRPETSLHPDTATALLTGMIAETKNFKKKDVDPKSLEMASQLIEAGADRDQIIRALYHTKSLAMLRLWGKALTHLNYDKDLWLVSTSITHEDFVETKAHEEDLYAVIDEIIVNSPEEKMTLLLHEPADGDAEDKQTSISVLFQVEPGLDALDILAPFNPIGSASQVHFSLTGIDLKTAEEQVIAVIRKSIKK